MHKITYILLGLFVVVLIFFAASLQDAIANQLAFNEPLEDLATIFVEPDDDWTEGLNLLAEELLDKLISKLGKQEAEYLRYFPPYGSCFLPASCKSIARHLLGGWWRRHRAESARKQAKADHKELAHREPGKRFGAGL